MTNRTNRTNKKQNGPSFAKASEGKPLVSVVIPVYNGAKYLHLAVDSVLKSTYTNYEIVLVDDGSTDKSKNLCRMYAKRYENVRFFDFPKNKGLGRVLNFALKKAKGTYICRINQDDQMYPTRIEKQVAFLETHPDVILIGSWLLVEDEQGNRRINQFLEHDKDIKKTWLTLSPCWDASVMYKKESALAVGGYNQKFWPADDLHMWYRLGRLGKIANIQEPLVKIKFHGAATSVKCHKKHMLATYNVHRWAHDYVEEASIMTQTFWVCELIAGCLLPAQLNWSVYRFIKKYFVYAFSDPRTLLSRTQTFLIDLSYVTFP